MLPSSALCQCQHQCWYHLVYPLVDPLSSSCSTATELERPERTASCSCLSSFVVTITHQPSMSCHTIPHPSYHVTSHHPTRASLIVTNIVEPYPSVVSQCLPIHHPRSTSHHVTVSFGFTIHRMYHCVGSGCVDQVADITV